ncbi:MAG: eukaryotic-like serine/threonine-protein kinase [Streptosporangiaceae bacterium]|nr:eukaryotic-like serine/threonine-protein kinase [Streptosporangiaceae bacterium]
MSQPGVRVLGGRYQILDRLGRGGMGAVWRARDELLARDVAVKEILLPQGLDEEQLAVTRGRALREARAAAQVRHPAVVTIHDVVIEDGHPWIVMDYVRARSLDDHLRDVGALSVAETARIGEALIGALEAIHDHGIVHRDIKPANILLSGDRQVVLTDFGIATIEGDVRFTASGLLIGTPGYMAPERLAGRAVGPPSDLWSLGAVLYTAVEGHSPYEGSTPMMIASAVLTGDPVPPRRSGALGPVITGLLARDPADRMDARTAADRLAALVRDPDRPAGSRSQPPHPGDRTRRDPPGEVSASASAPATRPVEASSEKEIGRVPDWLSGPTSGFASGAELAGRAASWQASVLRSARIAATVTVAIALVGIVTWIVSSVPSGGIGGATGLTVDPCALLTTAQLRTLAPGMQKTPSLDSAECAWKGAAGSAALTIRLESFTKDEQATTALRDLQTRASLESQPTLGIGNEAYSYDQQRTGQVGNTRIGQMEVLFRRNRNVVKLDYDGPREQENGLQAARWVDAALSRSGR